MSIITTAYVGRSGHELFVFATLADGSVVENITSVSGTLGVQVNGSPVTMGPATWTNGTLQCPYVAFLFPSPPIGPLDVVTYTLTAGGITTAAGSSPAVSSPAAVANYVGQYEPGIGQCTGFTPHRQMPVGVDMAHPHMDQFFGFPVPRNNRLRMVYAGPASTTATVVWNSTDPSLPDSWTPAGTIEFALCNTSIQNAVDGLGTPSMTGQYSIVFDDIHANDGNALQVWINGNLSNCVGADAIAGQNQFPIKASVHNGLGAITLASSNTLQTGQTVTFSPDNSAGTYTIVAGGTGTAFTITPVFGGLTNASVTMSNPYYSRTVSGNTVTVTYQLAYTPGMPTGYNFVLNLYLKSPSGNFNAGGVISNFWIFFPGDEANDRSDRYALSAVANRFLKAPNGRGPAFIRCMDQVAAGGAIINIQEPADMVADDVFTWGYNNPRNIPLVAARIYNTNAAKDNVTGDGTYPWAASTKAYHPLLGNQTDPDVNLANGKYVDIGSATGYWGAGAQDYGRWIDIQDGVSPTDNSACCEFRSQSPHRLRSGDYVDFSNLISTSLGNVTATNGLAAVTFGTSQTFATGAPMTFSKDPSGTVYQIVTGGTGTSFNVTPNFAGTYRHREPPRIRFRA